MKKIKKILPVTFVACLFFVLITVSAAYESDGFSFNEFNEEIDYDFLQMLIESYEDDPDFISIDINFDEILGIYTYTAVLKGINDTPQDIVPGMTYCWCYGSLMREIVDNDGVMRHEPITEEEYMNENSYLIISGGEFFKRSYGSDGVCHEVPITIYEYLEYFKNVYTDEEYIEFETMIKANYLQIDSEIEINIDESIMGDCTSPCSWGLWRPNVSWCYRNCTRCGKRNIFTSNGVQGHHISKSEWISNTQHNVRCSQCSQIRGTFNHTWSGWQSISATQCRRSCVQGSSVGCGHVQTQAHVWGLQNNVTKCAPCGRVR